jgi:hypothetical protein
LLYNSTQKYNFTHGFGSETSAVTLTEYQIKEDDMGEACSTHQKSEIHKKYYVRKCEGMRKLDRTRCRWEDNTEIDLGYTECDGIVYIWLRTGTRGLFTKNNEPLSCIKGGDLLTKAFK